MFALVYLAEKVTLKTFQIQVYLAERVKIKAFQILAPGHLWITRVLDFIPTDHAIGSE